ncbi:MAG: DUF5667 domain-containing protein [Candidatus Paceibacterota bacterium]
MKNDLNKGAQEIRDIKLSPEEKKVVLSRLLAHMDEHPVRFVVSPYQHFFHSRFAYALAGALLMFSVTSGGVALASEGALPGDLLYPVKIYVTEPVRGALIIGTVQKAQWVEEKTVRRFDEAESLATQGRLSTTTIQTIKENVEKNTNEFHAIVQASEAQASSTEMERVHTDFEKEIESRAQILNIATSTPRVRSEESTRENARTATSTSRGTREREEEDSENSNDRYQALPASVIRATETRQATSTKRVRESDSRGERD